MIDDPLHLDDFALGLGMAAEDLGRVPRPPLPFEGRAVDSATLEFLHSPNPPVTWTELSPADRSLLIERGWYTAGGDLTESGVDLRMDLVAEPRTAHLWRSDISGLRCGRIIAGEGQALVFADALVQPWPPDDGSPAPGEDRGDPVGLVDRPVDPLTNEPRSPGWRVLSSVIPAPALPIVIGKWAGLAPFWSFETLHEPFPASCLASRIRDPGAALPDGADGLLSVMWTQPWLLWGLKCCHRHQLTTYVHAGNRGQFRVDLDGDDRVRLVARPGTLVWGELQRVCAGRSLAVV